MERPPPSSALRPDEAARLLAEGRDRLRDAAATDVLIIEDEPIIAMDIEELVQNCGHRIVGSQRGAGGRRYRQATRPGLILADINLGAGGDGTNAVARIMQSHYAPVIFVTAYPERLLTGDSIEPAFVITKPFDPMTLAIATYQAVTGGVISARHRAPPGAQSAADRYRRTLIFLVSPARRSWLHLASAAAGSRHEPPALPQPSARPLHRNSLRGRETGTTPGVLSRAMQQWGTP